MRCDAYVAAVPPWSLEKMGLGMLVPGEQTWRSIVGVHLFMEDADWEFDCAGIAGEPFGWVFNKTTDFGLGFRVPAGGGERGRWHRRHAQG